jgi:hypothetical protein
MGGGGGGGSNPIEQIANNISRGASNAGNWVGDRIGGNVGHVVGGYVTGAIPGGGPLGMMNPGGGIGGPIGAANAALGDPFGKRPDPPKAPGVDAGVAGMQQASLQQARQFRQNLGTNEQKAFETFGQAQNRSMNRDLHTVNQNNSARGLLYGGINQGQQQAVRAQGQVDLAKGRASINNQYNQAANQMDAAAVGNGVAVQQYQQGIQDQIYNQALMQMMNKNAAFGSLMNAGGMAAGMALA